VVGLGGYNELGYDGNGGRGWGLGGGNDGEVRWWV
jgi:hypothetical protein